VPITAASSTATIGLIMTSPYIQRAGRTRWTRRRTTPVALRGFDPAVAYNPTSYLFLVVWSGDDIQEL
jgi:hypothetical protein